MPGVYLGRGLSHLIVLAFVLLRRGSFKTQRSVEGTLDTRKQRPPGTPGQTASTFPRRSGPPTRPQKRQRQDVE